MRVCGKGKGAVLIIVLGILAVLALLATAFATLQATERKISRNYLDMVRAKLLAQSGIEHTVHRLSLDMPRGFLGTPGIPASDDWVYFGDDLTGNSVHEPGEEALRKVGVVQGARPS
jgi:hypothetical protein